MRTLSAALFVSILFVFISLHAGVKKVPQDFAQIQLAINAAVNGDTVLVAEGTYIENIVINKKIILASQFYLDNDTSHISKTIIDGSKPSNKDSASVIVVTSGSDSTTLIRGFTIQGGRGTRIGTWCGGGGIIIIAGAATIMNNRITKNVFTADGSANSFFGVGIGMSPIVGPLTPWAIIGNRIEENGGTGRNGEGGGAWLTGTGKFIGNTVSQNYSFYLSNLGTGYARGGGLCIQELCNIDFADNIISGNTSTNQGGGIFCTSLANAPAVVRFTNNIICSNRSELASAGMHIWGGTYTLIHNTIVDNVGVTAIRLVDTRAPLKVSLLNNIVWNPNVYQEIHPVPLVSTNWNCIRGGSNGTSNIDLDPGFVPGDSLYNLSSSSYCIGRGIDSAQFSETWLNAPNTDINNRPRRQPAGSSPDLGAQENASGVVRTSLPHIRERWNFNWETKTRTGLVYVPNLSLPAKGFPVVFNLHGYGDYDVVQRQISPMHLLGDSVGFITVYPEGYTQAWNNSDNYVPIPNVDDVGFISLFIDSLKARYKIDTQRVYACGYSNGGFMSIKLASLLSARIAAAGAVCGVIGNNVAATFAAMRPVPLQLIVGTADGIVPYNGGIAEWYSVPATIEFYGKQLNYKLPPDSVNLADINTADGSTVERLTYHSSTSNATLEMLRVTNGGHEWPGRAPYQTSGIINQDIDANKELWNFFKQFTLQNTLNGIIDKQSVAPLEYALSQNYPNPFNPSTTIRYALPSSANVKISIYDLLGREIATLVNEEQSAGWKEVQWNAKNFSSGMSSKGGYASGVYLVRMQALHKDGQRLDLSSGQAGNYSDTKKILLMK